MVGGGTGSGRASATAAEEFRSPMLHFPMLHDDEEPSELFTRNPLYRELVIEVTSPHIHTMFDTHCNISFDYTYTVTLTFLLIAFHQLLLFGTRRWVRTLLQYCSPISRESL